MGAGIYIHIPFCVRKCPYCSFYSVDCSEGMMDKFTEKTLMFIENCPYNLTADTIYFGGGTPTAIGTERLSKLLKKAREKFNFTEGEITLEANPATVDYESLKKLREAGFNRLSMGVQSGNDHELEMLGRLHDSKSAQKTFYEARKAGFENISLDIMLGLPGQTIDAAENSAREIISLNPDHISAYMLKIEEGTVFYDRYAVTEEFEDSQGNIYLHICEFLSKKGYEQYEISNFSKKGFESRHNTKYWKLENYLGIGPSAHSKLGKKRFYMSSSLEEYLKGKSLDELMLYEGEAETFEEYVMLGLRLREGLDLWSLERIFPHSRIPLLKKAEEIIKYGYAEIDGDKLRLTLKGFLISNYVISRLV